MPRLREGECLFIYLLLQTTVCNKEEPSMSEQAQRAGAKR